MRRKGARDSTFSETPEIQLGNDLAEDKTSSTPAPQAAVMGTLAEPQPTAKNSN